MTEHISTISIPAYDSLKNGLIIDLHLTVFTSKKFSVTTKGSIAQALKSNFERVIDVMGSIKTAWKCFESYSYILESTDNNFIVKDSKSASMALAIILLNVYRKIHGKLEIPYLTGTGILRSDGTFDSANLEMEKKKAMIAKKNFSNFITSSKCNHLYELEELMNNY
jgi:hypothetical protein